MLQNQYFCLQTWARMTVTWARRKCPIETLNTSPHFFSLTNCNTTVMNTLITLVSIAFIATLVMGRPNWESIVYRYRSAHWLRNSRVCCHSASVLDRNRYREQHLGNGWSNWFPSSFWIHFWSKWGEYEDQHDRPCDYGRERHQFHHALFRAIWDH